MTKYLFDTNVVLRFCNSSDRQHSLATDSISYLLTQGDECFLTAQVISAMDKLAKYREIVRKIISEYATHKPYHGQIDVRAIIDSERGRYQVL